jgi:ribosomal protein S30
MNVYNDTFKQTKSQSGKHYKNICPQQKNIVNIDVRILIDKVYK